MSICVIYVMMVGGVSGPCDVTCQYQSSVLLSDEWFSSNSVARVIELKARSDLRNSHAFTQ